MNIQEFITNPESKYAVITLESYMTDPTAQSLTNSPAVINFNGIELVILSIPTEQISELADYAVHAGNGVEFELTIGSGKVTLLTHPEAIKLVAQATPEAVDEVQPL
jgi:hypothetical protein